MFPYEKYKYFTNNKDLVIAEQTYAGKKYRGRAVLGGDDVFDLETGKRLAAARCDFTICSKRYKAAHSKVKHLEKIIELLSKELETLNEYRSSSLKEFANSADRLCVIEEELGVIPPID